MRMSARVNMEIVLVLDNIRSLYNVGSMFRTADGFGVRRIILCGITGTPEQNGLKKVALGAELAVPWEKTAHAWRAIERLKKDGYAVVGLERCADAAPIGKYRPPKKLALVVGNEVDGIARPLRRRLDAVLEIPMRGTKESFNVAVACGIALYALTAKK
jgi:23S rRNA (guanosine2251-2'-O)-methyltransferase